MNECWCWFNVLNRSLHVDLLVVGYFHSSYLITNICIYLLCCVVYSIYWVCGTVPTKFVLLHLFDYLFGCATKSMSTESIRNDCTLSKYRRCTTVHLICLQFWTLDSLLSSSRHLNLSFFIFLFCCIHFVYFFILFSRL